MTVLCFSSETYKIDPKDLTILEDAAVNYSGKNKDKVIVLIGDGQNQEKDCLLSGRAIAEEAIKKGMDFIPVKIAFNSKIKRLDFISPFIKALRNRQKFFSSNIYHMDPKEIRRMKIERNIRTKQNAYVFTNPLFSYTKQERDKQYNELYNSMKRGYDDNFPIDIMLLRMMGIRDTINQGHHRMGIALDCNLPRVAVMFSAAGQAPVILQPLLRIIAHININLKLWKKK